MARSSLPHQRGDASKTDHVAASEPIARPCCPEKLKYLSHLAKHKGRSIAIVLVIGRREAAPCFGRRQMWDRIGSSSAMATLDFDSVDRCFAAVAATGFVGFIAVLVWAWLS